jgi:uncharacterized membrane protein YkgB
MKETIESRIAAIEARNQRVEHDKAWETSWTRRISILLLTYIVVAVYLTLVVRIDPWVNAIVPAIGFMLSTMTLSFLKKEWLRRHNS